METLLSALQKASDDAAHPTASEVKRFLKLVEGDSPLQPYLELLLPSLTQVLAASAGMVWFRAHGSQTACFAIRYQMEKIGWGEKESVKHDRILQLAWQQRQPILVEPQIKKKGVLEEGQFHLVIGPIIHLGEPLALVEVLLPARGVLDPGKRKAILRAMQLLIESIHSGMQRRIQLPAASMTQASAQIQQLEGEIEAYQLSIQKTIEARLRHFQGWTFGSLAENQQFAKMVQKILEEHGLRVRCPECGNPSILRCANAGNSKNGVFVFDHYLDSGRTFHGGPTTFPAITVVPKPARRIRLNAS